MSLRFCIGLFFCLMALSPLGAQENALPAPQTDEQGEAQHLRANALRKEAEARRAEEEAVCYQKILVNSCLEDAHKRYTETIVEVRRIEAQARESQRAARRAEVEAEKSRREAERPAREAEQQKRAERYRAEEAAKASVREERRLKKARQAEENRKKLAEEREKRQLKAEKRAKK